MDTSLPPKRRILGGSITGSEVITGVLLLQTRKVSHAGCSFRFSKLQVLCALSTPTQHVSGQQSALAPFGREPAFNPSKPRAYDPGLAGREGDFFNMSAGSSEVASTGFPFAFFPRPVKGLRTTREGFPVVFGVCATCCLVHAMFACAQACLRCMHSRAPFPCKVSHLHAPGSSHLRSCKTAKHVSSSCSSALC